MKHSTLRIDCPCCGATLEVDRDNGAVLSHSPGRPRAAAGLKSLDDGLAKLKEQDLAREAAFQKSIERNRRQDEDLDKKFAGLLKKQQGRKFDRPPIREFDLD